MVFSRLRSLFLLGIFFVAPAQADRLTVEVSGYENVTGNVVVGLYGKENEFPIKGKSLHKQVAKTKEGRVRFVFADLPKGDYAVVAYHDANLNDEFDKNFLGIPQEMFGFTNKAKASLSGPPSFEEARIVFKADNQVESIELVSW